MSAKIEKTSPAGTTPAKRHLPASARGTILAGTAIVLATFFGFGAWASMAPLASAVVAPATVIAEGRKRVVQHYEGGIVSQVNVREGEVVQYGDVLFRLDPIQAQSRAERLRGQLDARIALGARLEAERDGRVDIAFPPAMTERVAEDPLVALVVERERELFVQRRVSLDGQLELLGQKIVQLRSEIEGLDAQEESKLRQTEIIETELADLRPLLDQGLIARPRFLALEREAARLKGEIGEVVSRRARSGEAITEAKLQMEQLRQQFREEVVTQLRDVENQIADLEQQYIAARDVLERLAIVAPETGIAQAVKITTIGAVITPGQPLLEIAPMTSDLSIETRISPASIHDVSLGMMAEVRFVSLDMRRTPTIRGSVEAVSGDRLIDPQSGVEYFLAQVEVSAEELRKLGDQRVGPGMPAEVVIPTGSRSMLDYLVKPLLDALQHGLHER